MDVVSMIDIPRCRSIIMGEGASKAALSREDLCVAGYIEYKGRIFSIAIYEYSDIGVFAAKISLDLYSDMCSDILYDPHGLIAYAKEPDSLCKAIVRKIKRYLEIYSAGKGSD
ncbi:MAG: hypothetical protein DJ555_01960 [Desulfurococcaceae archaeon]|jgi:hypothetical protein|nr:MAG: hypothetical protein DJ555_01960 [Desulfurococcaceae archaeon]